MQQAAGNVTGPPPRLGLALYALTIFVGAFLLFQVQPIIGKYVLPWFGGSAGVWAAALLFFQLFLLLGYTYAHVVSTWLGLRGQAIVHLAIGKTELDERQLLENYAALLDEIIRQKPAAAKGRYLRTITLTTTMGPGVRVDAARTRDVVEEIAEEQEAEAEAAAEDGQEAPAVA